MILRKMAEYAATVTWKRAGAVFTDNRYSRAHRWLFDGGTAVPASSSPQIVPEPLSDPVGVDPEEAFVAALASCHMLFFLSIAAKRGLIVDSYTDNAAARMGKDECGRQMIVEVTLRPAVRYGTAAPGEQEERAMHDDAHEQCFLANSVRSRVTILPETAGRPIV